jgi:hypothetical protein
MRKEKGQKETVKVKRRRKASREPEKEPEKEPAGNSEETGVEGEETGAGQG